MYLLEYTYWKTAEHLVNSGYGVIQAGESGEIWLEAPDKSSYDLVRLYKHDIDFRQEMARDIEEQAERVEQVRKQLGRRKMKLLNVFFSAEAPVDDWEEIAEKPFEKGPVLVDPAIVRGTMLHDDLQAVFPSFRAEECTEARDSFEDAQMARERFLSLVLKQEEQRKNEAAVFQNGKPIFTYVFIALQVLMFFLLELNGGSTNTQTLVSFGAKENSLIAAGEWWRLLTPIVLHIGIAHLAFNTLALWSVGTAVERMYGSGRFLLIYLAAGITGSIASFVFSPYPSAGASGAIFGCLGALLYVALSNRKMFLRTIGTNIIVIIIINLGFGFAVSNIDNSGHIGGLIGGFFAAAALGLPKAGAFGKRLLSAVLLIALAAGFLYYGLHSPSRQESVLIQQASELYQEGKYEEVTELLNGEAEQKDASVDLLKILAVSDIQIGEYDQAISLLERVVEKEPKDHASYYNLALLYAEKNELGQAEEAIKSAVKLKPKEQRYKELQQQIENNKES
ncbi:rhomboid protease YqgP [Bacillus inaquosorum]|uniref:rhomboid protease YqgP n=1 Tax=Bacillus inaquosorum TaxID=483913 RepID=UPI00227FF6D9|nr:rhomboid protease YqgP [Bacillus inaquosorum]MCY7899170.1 rhomboid protease YqgP [Bacillus inaquosorum]MCY8056730.1 rhomboid protease YqgP [Bacillus inaquosorum]MCY8261039.1 rhomboid protease YqgP [Bacillus inaquosorum]MCY8284479.1 rhomboid protease YqgP [Bacillus inaquosorum]MCY9410215.1 rhomboid protease YqgP [Bacillus inaquosorum]